MTCVAQPCECGGNLVRFACKGRTCLRYDLMVAIPDNIAIPTCEMCGQFYVDDVAEKELEIAWAKDLECQELIKAFCMVIDYTKAEHHTTSEVLRYILENELLGKEKSEGCASGKVST